ncbi:glycoside hydrolase family 97 catalytic domain-containing protein [Kribbella sp. NBC_01245]|uniref:glycoside hydrolase family 97 catalytic domain-containing protein n=1 Tax=Kribbella sp. NBC_01245 TaxID=2903578 RepID=UPI002E2A48C0|nr:glycoside hydrolase family 97 catalytic domain-containing protein [Kribbella sp. NBC_01245]
MVPRSILRGLAVAALLPALALPPATASPVAVDTQPTATWRLQAASGPSAKVELSEGGRLSLAVEVNGATPVRAVDLGLVTATADLSGGLTARGQTTREVRETYLMTTGKQRQRTVLAQETRLRFANPAGAEFTLIVRTSDDGVAYRYELPAATTVERESGGYEFAGDATSWLQPYNPQHENEHAQATAATAPTGQFGHPALFLAGGNYVLLAESGLDGRYAGARLRHTQGTPRYDVLLADERPVTGVSRTAWRTMIVGDLATVTASTMVDDLADPAKFTDTSWIKPGVSSWSWLAENSSPRDFERQKDYVDAAAKNNFKYVLVDEGWSESWIPALTRYARARGVEVLVWFHWTNLESQAQRDNWLPRLTNWGVKGVKVDFMESDSQARYQWYDAILADTAKHQLMINFHGSTVPHGLARTWPHLMTMEGVRGEENGLNASRNTILPFTRNVIGSMDYTPTRFATLSNPKPQTSNAHELALPIVYESGWTHVVSTPEELASQPEGARMLAQLPTTWDEMRLLAGQPGQEAIVARRNGQRWFIGGIRSGGATSVDVPLSMLGTGRWLVETITDDGPTLRRTSQTWTAADKLTIPVVDRGGFAIQACPATTGRTTCDVPYLPAPSTTVLVDADKTEIAPNETVRVQGIFVARTGGVVSDLELAPVIPRGWSLVAGRPVRKTRLTEGQSVSGSWTLKLLPGGVRGDLELVVAGNYTAPDGRRVYSSDATPIFAEPLPPTGSTYVSDLPWTDESNGYGRAQQRDHSHGGDKPPGTLTIGGKTYAKGVGAHAPSSLTTWLGANCTRFVAEVGVDDGTQSTEGSVGFIVVGDGRELARTPVIRAREAATVLDLDVTGVKRLTLATNDGGNGKNSDHADWGIASLACKS